MANMSRKDSKGRKLKEGETERKDGRYVYRYTNQKTGKRESIYAKDLADLRKKEKEINSNDNYILNDAALKNLTVNDMFERLLETREISESTRANYLSAWNNHIKNNIGEYRIIQLLPSDIKKFYVGLAKEGYSHGLIKIIHNILHPALELAVEDGFIMRNPTKSALGDYGNAPKERNALTIEQQVQLLEFVKTDSIYNRYYPMLVIMLGTGLRCGELCGLTSKDVDMEKREVHVTHQLIYKNFGDGLKLHVSMPKTASGIRTIPMTENVFQAFREQKKMNSLLRKNKEKFVVDGYTDFIFITKNGHPLIMSSINKVLNNITKAINGQNKGSEPFPHISAHIMRHTFCTRGAENGLDIKALQHVMGHSDANITMQVYNHISDMARIEKELAKMVSLTDF